MVMAQTAEPIEKRIRVDGVKTGKVTALDVPGQIAQALTAGIISDTEAAMLREYDRKVMELISVDDFDDSELAAQAEPEPESRTAHGEFRASGQVA
jgi:acyl-CoA dehydrogenase